MVVDKMVKVVFGREGSLEEKNSLLKIARDFDGIAVSVNEHILDMAFPNRRFAEHFRDYVFQNTSLLMDNSCGIVEPGDKKPASVPHYELETRYEIWDNKHGSKIVIGPDRDGGDLYEICEFENGNARAAICLNREQMQLLYQALHKILAEGDG